jgi:hypothetical protein
MTVFRQDVEEWFSKPLGKDDDGDKRIRETGLALSLAILETTQTGHDQERAITRIRETCLTACASRRFRRF